MAFGNVKRNFIERSVYFLEKVITVKRSSGGASKDRKTKLRTKVKYIRREVERRYPE